MDNCIDCKYFRDTALTDKGLCYRYPPRVINGMSVLPTVRTTGTCGEFMLKGE